MYPQVYMKIPKSVNEWFIHNLESQVQISNHLLYPEHKFAQKIANMHRK